MVQIYGITINIIKNIAILLYTADGGGGGVNPCPKACWPAGPGKISITSSITITSHSDYTGGCNYTTVAT